MALRQIRLLTSAATLALGSIHVAQIALVGLHQCHVDVFRGGFGAEAAVVAGDVDERVVNVLRHAMRVATDVEVGAALQPCPDFLRVFEHPVLDVNLLRLVAGERGVQAGEHAVLLPRVELGFVEEVGGAMLLAEEKPVASLGSGAASDEAME